MFTHLLNPTTHTHKLWKCLSLKKKKKENHIHTCTHSHLHRQKVSLCPLSATLILLAFADILEQTVGWVCLLALQEAGEHSASWVSSKPPRTQSSGHKSTSPQAQGRVRGLKRVETRRHCPPLPGRVSHQLVMGRWWADLGVRCHRGL